MEDFLMLYGEMFSIIIFFIPAILSMSIFYFTKRNWIWLSIPITIMVDLLAWGKGLIFESSHGGIVLVFLIPQVTVVVIISFIILCLKKRRKKT